MPSEPRLSYWDSNLFIHYAAGSPEWIDALDALITEARSGDLRIATSAFSMVEAAFTPSEKDNAALSREVELAFRTMLEDFTLVRVVEFDRQIAGAARDLMRSVLPDRRSLKPGDAIHVATARALGADVFFSTDNRLRRLCAEYQWRHASEPVSRSPRMPGL